MSALSGDRKMAEARRTLALLNKQSERLRAELATLRDDLAQARRDTSEMQAVQLLEANEQLVLAALRADAIAETAVRDLAVLTRASQRLSEGEPQLQAMREANEQLVIAALTAQELEAQAGEIHRRQIKFLAIVAHELRNPLAPIRTAAELLGRARADEPLLAQVQGIIERQVAHMSRLVDDLLDESSAGAGKFRLERSIVDLAGAIAMAVEKCRPAMEARRQHLEMLLPPGVLRVNGDPLRLAQIFGNLLDNASKYTPEGGSILVTAVLLDSAVAVTVSDDGIGIPAEALPHVFDIFVQDARAKALRSGGLGIGLAVVRDLVEAHGGTVAGSSRGIGLGSEFVVTLPLVAGELDAT